MQEISDMFKSVDMLIKSCDVDYGLIRKETIDENLFNDYDFLLNGIAISFNSILAY